MRKFCLFLIAVALAGGAFGAEGDTDKSRALTEARVRILEKVVKASRAAFERGRFKLEELIVWTERFYITKLELAATPEERVAVAEKRLEGAKELHAVQEARERAGVVRPLDVLCAELNIREADQALLQVKNHDDAEKMRALSEARLKVLEKIVEERQIRFERGLAASEEVLLSTDQLLKAKMALAATPKERVALAEKRLEGAKVRHASQKERIKFGKAGQLELLLAELKILEAELALLQVKKQDDSEKARALSKAKLIYFENVVETTKIRVDRGLATTGDVLLSMEQLLKAKMELAATPEERIALAEDRLAGAKKFYESAEVRHKRMRGIETQLELLLAELNILEAEQTLLRVKLAKGNHAAKR